ncbi:MAG: DNA double-strand break repair nuclease NurA [Candidatus Aquicultorales bacterium]
MLDFRKLYPQITDFAGYRSDLKNERARKIELARACLTNADGAALRLKAERSKTSWLVGLAIDEEPCACIPAEAERPPYIAVSTDGSQIGPSRDGTGQLHLVNIGEVAIGYGANPFAVLESHPSLSFDEIETTVRFGGEERQVTGTVLAAKRDAAEYSALKHALAEHARDERPIIGLVDGTLILWHIEPRAEAIRNLGSADLKRAVFNALFELLDGVRDTGALVAAYLSAPGSREAVNLLKLDLCPEAIADCNQCPIAAKEERPCIRLDGLTDSLLFAGLLRPGERSAVFESTSSNASSILGHYPPHLRPCFFYVNVGSEIARVEIPFWLGEDVGKRSLLHALVVDQAAKGEGYPIVVAEAHEQAVVKGTDREAFNRAVEAALVKKGVSVEDSRKSVNKRRSFV